MIKTLNVILQKEVKIEDIIEYLDKDRSITHISHKEERFIERIYENTEGTVVGVIEQNQEPYTEVIYKKGYKTKTEYDLKSDVKYGHIYDTDYITRIYKEGHIIGYGSLHEDHQLRFTIFKNTDRFGLNNLQVLFEYNDLEDKSNLIGTDKTIEDFIEYLKSISLENISLYDKFINNRLKYLKRKYINRILTDDKTEYVIRDVKAIDNDRYQFECVHRPSYEHMIKYRELRILQPKFIRYDIDNMGMYILSDDKFMCIMR